MFILSRAAETDFRSAFYYWAYEYLRFFGLVDIWTNYSVRDLRICDHYLEGDRSSSDTIPTPPTNFTGRLHTGDGKAFSRCRDLAWNRSFVLTLDTSPLFGTLKRKHGDTSVLQRFPLWRLGKYVAAEEALAQLWWINSLGFLFTGVLGGSPLGVSLSRNWAVIERVVLNENFPLSWWTWLAQCLC